MIIISFLSELNPPPLIATSLATMISALDSFIFLRAESINCSSDTLYSALKPTKNISGFIFFTEFIILGERLRCNVLSFSEDILYALSCSDFSGIKSDTAAADTKISFFVNRFFS